MRIALTALCLALLTADICGAQTPRTPRQHARAPLGFSQIQQLVEIGTPDEVIAQEISERGIAPVPSRAEIDRLAQRGAGSRTLAALRAFAKAVLNITSRPGQCDVLIDGKAAGRTGPDGRLSVEDVSVGEHSVRVQKDGFQPADFPVTVAVGGQASVAAALESARGSLTVITGLSDATIRISGVGTYRGAARGVNCPSGSYEVDVTAPGFEPVQRSAIVSPGQVTEISVKLEPNGEIVEQLRQELRSRDNGRNAGAAMQAAERLLRYAPSDPEATAALAAGQFASGNASAFSSTGPKALSLGGTIILRLVHNHVHGLVPEHEALLAIISSGVTFDALGAPCTLHAGKIPADRITRVQLVHQRVVRNGSIVYRDYMDIEFRQERREKKTASMKFTTVDQLQYILNTLVEVVSGIAGQQTPASRPGGSLGVQ